MDKYFYAVLKSKSKEELLEILCNKVDDNIKDYYNEIAEKYEETQKELIEVKSQLEKRLKAEEEQRQHNILMASIDPDVKDLDPKLVKKYQIKAIKKKRREEVWTEKSDSCKKIYNKISMQNQSKELVEDEENDNDISIADETKELLADVKAHIKSLESDK